MRYDRLDTIGQLLHTLRQVPVDEQVAYLEQECRDEDVREEVLSLLSHTEEATGFFDDVVNAVVENALDDIFGDSRSGATKADPLELEGARIAGYEVEKHIGTGGMGVVYRATDTELNRPVALKFLSPFLVSDEEAAERFTREARSVAALDDPRIATIYEIGEAANGLRFIAMAYYSGETLKDKIAGGPLPVDRALAYAIQIAEGLRSAHRAGIVHRDVKPGNVIVLPDGDIKLVDFGLAKAASGGHLTRSGRRMGTAAYMSPEMATNEAVDERSDLWALGVTLYEMVTGERPFQAAHDTAILYAIVHKQPRRPVEYRPEIPPVAEQIIMKLLAKTPANRYQLAGDVLRDLRAVRKGESPVVRVPEAASEKSGESIAVLPFETLGSGEVSTFTQGVHGDVLTRLSNIADLRVISRTSVRKYQGTDRSIRQIGQELNAGWIMEGEVQEIADQVRVHVRLIDARKDQNVWAKNFQRRLTAEQLFQIQEEITRQIVRELQAHLSPQEKKRIGKAPTDDLTAYRLYAEGRRKLDQRTGSAMRKAVDLFERATEHDPAYALAWVGLADACALLYDYGHARREQTLPRARQAAEKALAIDPDLAAAHASLGLLHSNRHEGPEAIAALQRAVELQPSYAEAHNWLSWNYQLLGEAEKALESAEREVELNPLSAEAVCNLSASSITIGDGDRALAEATRGEELEPEWASPTFHKGLVLYHLQRFEECIDALDGLSAPWSGKGAEATVALARIRINHEEAARKTLSGFEEEEAHFAAGLLQAALGEMDRAFASFARITYWDDWPTLAAFHYYPDVLGPLREDVRWSDVMRSLKRDRGLADESGVSPETPELDARAVAVIPFADLSGTDSAATFAAGFHHDLLTKLSRVSGLTVISSVAVQKYEDGEWSMQEIARELNAGTLVRGGIQEVAGRLRLNAHLLDTSNEQLRWSETYDRDLTKENLFEIQSELATRIAESLRTALTPEEKKRVEERPAEDFEAYRLCAYGRTHMDRRTGQSMRRAFELFRQATDKAPDYAPGWAGLAEVLALASYYRPVLPTDAPDAMDVARRAIELDPSLAEAHGSLGILYAHAQDGPAAVRSLQRAIELKPSYAEAHNWLGWMHMIVGDPARGIQPAERAAALNPIAPYVPAFLGQIYLADGRAEKALRESVQAREIQPDYAIAHYMEGLSLYHLSRFEEAVFALREAASLAEPEGGPARYVLWPALFAAYTAAGAEDEASRVRDRIEDGGEPFARGMMHAVNGEDESALDAFMAVDRWDHDTTPPMRFLFPDVLGTVRQKSAYEEVLLRIDHSWRKRPGSAMR